MKDNKSGPKISTSHDKQRKGPFPYNCQIPDIVSGKQESKTD